MKKHIVKIMMLFALPALAMVSCDDFERTQVEPTITVDHSSITLFAGETMQLTASPSTLNFVWSSTNDEIATVDSNGLVTAIAEGAASIVAKSGDLVFETEVTVQIEVPMESVTLRCEESIELAIGTTRTIAVDTAPYDANDIPLDDFAWWSDDETIVRVSDAGVIKAVGAGTANINYRRGHFTCSVEVTCAKSFPFKPGQPFVLSDAEPLVLMFRDFDRGGQGAAYNDTAGGSPGTYRAQNGDNSGRVCVEGGGNLGYTTGGEWLSYTLDVKTAGTYECVIRAGAGSAGWRGNYQFFLDQPNVAEAAMSEAFQMDSAGGWGNWNNPTTVQVHFENTGVQRMIFYMHDGAHNLMDMTFTFVE